MNLGLFISGVALLIVAASAITWHRRREQTARKTRGRLHGWRPSDLRDKDFAERLSGLTLFQVGHSRRIEGLMQGPDRSWVFSYVCQTGFEHRRVSHIWLVVVLEIDSLLSPVMITSQDWLISMARLSPRREVSLSSGGAQPTDWRVFLEDPEEWSPQCLGELQAMLTRQSPDRTWEILPGFVVGYEPGRFDEDVFLTLPPTVHELGAMVERRGSAPKASELALAVPAQGAIPAVAAP